MYDAAHTAETATSADTTALSATTPTISRGSVHVPSLNDEHVDLLEFTDDRFDDHPEPSDTPPWWRRRWLPVVAAVVLIAIVAAAISVKANAAPKPVTYQTATVRQGNLILAVSGTGPVQASIYNLSFAVSGRIAQIDVKLGQHVVAGQTLAALDATNLQDALNQALLQSYTAYDQEQQAVNNCNTAKSPPPNCIALAENQYASALQQLKTAQDAMANATLKATHDGIITAINGTVGGSPGTGSGNSSSAAAATGFIQIVDPSSLQITANVNEADISGVAIGQPATFTATAFRGRTFRGTVSAVAMIGQTSSGVVTYPVTIDVTQPLPQGVNLLTGMTATVSITRAQRSGVLLIPATALSFARAAANRNAGGFLTLAQLVAARSEANKQLASLLAQNSQIAQDNPSTAWVVEHIAASKGQAAQWVVKPVVLGLTNGTNYEVLAGLSAGESVVIGEQNGTITTTSGTNSTGTNGRGGFGGFGTGGGVGGAGGARGGGNAGGSGTVNPGAGG